MKERRRLCSTALLCAVALLCLWSADAAEAGSRHPQGRFPQQVDQMPASLSENPLTKLVWGEARTHNGTKLHLLHGKCFSSNNQTCSGHGQCKKSGAAVFGTADTNVRRYYCACHPRYFGKACQLTFKDAQDRHLLRNKLLRVLRSARAGKMLETPDGTPRVPDDQGSVFGRMSPDNNGVKIRGRRMRGIIADRFQPTSNSRLEKWAMPNERNLFAGSGMLAQWQRERLSIQIVPDEYLHKKIRLPRRRAKFAFYMNDANGRIIKGPAVSKDQEMPWERDPSMPNPPGVKDPTATPFRTVLNMASPPKPAATAAPSPPAAPTATGAAK